MLGNKVYGSGRIPSQIALIGEGPGLQESIQGRPFVGASGVELDYLYLRRAAGLRREDIYVTNVVKWRTDETDRDPTDEEIARDEDELRTEIALCNPKIIVAVGRIAAQWFLGCKDVDMERVCAVPQWVYICDHCGKRGVCKGGVSGDRASDFRQLDEEDSKDRYMLDLAGSSRSGIRSLFSERPEDGSSQSNVYLECGPNTGGNGDRSSVFQYPLCESVPLRGSDPCGERSENVPENDNVPKGTYKDGPYNILASESPKEWEVAGYRMPSLQERDETQVLGKGQRPAQCCPSCSESRVKKYLCIVCYHPAAGLHAPERYIHQIYWQFQQLGRLVRGEIGPIDSLPIQHYSDRSAIEPLPESAGSELAIDTEGSAANPWGLSVASVEGRASVLRGRDEGEARAGLREALARVPVIGHNLLYDVNVLDALNAPIDLSRCEDTMLLAYLLPHLPRRLKALSYRLCGVEQDDYEDIIKPAEEEICKTYLQQVLGNKCTRCNGEGRIRKVSAKDPTKQLKSTESCGDCNGDGTNWPQPPPELIFDTHGAGRVIRTRGIGRRVRALLERNAGLRAGWALIDDSLRMPVESKLGPIREATLNDIPLDKAVHYSAADADCTLRVYHKLEPILKKEGLWRVYEIDKGILPIIHRMHTNGIRIDRDHYMGLVADFTSEQSGCLDRISVLCGSSINPSSPLQVAAIVYDKFGIKPNRGKRSTDEKTLEALKIKYKSRTDFCEFVDQITNYRELNKLIGTYAEPLPRVADANSRVHTQFLLHVTATGRIASRNPNLQNQPTRTERGRLIRRGFIAKEGCKLVSVDLDQIELRVAAHLSEDEGMVDVFRTGKDIHRATASLIYGKPMEGVSTQERLLSKTINFLILYGGGASRLNSELSLLGITTTKDQCVGYINDWFRAYPRVREYIDQCHSKAKSSMYVECLFGRRRYVPGVHSCIDRVREESLKWATNFPIQATAASLLKIWMRRVWDNVIPGMAREGYCEPLLTIHDEMIFEVQEGLEDVLIDRVVKEAALSAELLVPIKAKGASAMSWDLLK